ncbi:hypothetical protein SFC43_05425 [Bacteroides sp. CR5/BHMF/2]|nr:hypothetical protein [Bacteroides sp. CR5/BHMF/2]
MDCTLSFALLLTKRKEKTMAKVQMFAVLSLDGCLSAKTGDASWALRPESYGIDKLFGAADYEFSSTYPTSRLRRMRMIRSLSSKPNRRMQITSTGCSVFN